MNTLPFELDFNPIGKVIEKAHPEREEAGPEDEEDDEEDEEE